jgi:uncharacterized protein (TIGR01777 family)
MDVRRILITGATGFIGRALVGELTAKGYEVIALTRDPRKSESLFGARVRSAAWDGRTAEGWGPQADGALAIVNLAGDSLAEGRWTEAKKARILASRLESGAAVVEAIRAARTKPKVLVQASAVGFYGPRGDEPLDESSSPGDGFLAAVVRAWEDSTREAGDLGVRRVVARSGLVLGRDGGVLPRLVMPFRLFAGGPLGSGRQWSSWIHLSDEVRAIRFLVEREDLSGVFNLTAPHPLREKELCRAIGEVLRRPCWLPVPAFVLSLLFGEKARETLLGGQCVLPQGLDSAGFEFAYPFARQALEDLLRKWRIGRAQRPERTGPEEGPFDLRP